jgi:glycosyltransferase involved in cell wall biosynthesis
MNSRKILMIGWEFPPYNSGGLGVACQGIVENLVDTGEEVILLLPKVMSVDDPDEVYFETKKGNKYRVIYINTIIRPYVGLDGISYSGDLIKDVNAFASLAVKIAGNLDFDIIHVHDWLTVQAGVAIKEKYSKPLVMHVHSTEYDRTAGGTANEEVSAIEKNGFMFSNLIITVSKYTKDVLTKEYSVPAEKIMVVHNGVDYSPSEDRVSIDFLQGSPVIIFVGRLTIQKGPDFFLDVAKRVIDRRPDAIFVYAGNGDMYHHLLLTSAYKNLSGSVLFAGFLRDKAKDLLYKRADIFMMPSVSEPFGIVALEAAVANTAVIVSKTSGVAEVLPSAIKVDFWDTELMARKILELLEKTKYRAKVSQKVMDEAGAITWGKTAIKIKEVYYQLLSPESV